MVDVQRFVDVYAQPQSGAERAMEREACGANEGAWGYTTRAQADLLAERLALTRGMRLLDIGAGRGWPSLYLTRLTGCHATITDVPEPGIRDAQSRARRQRLLRRCSFIVASGTHLPFRPATFDAVIHTDTL